MEIHHTPSLEYLVFQPSIITSTFRIIVTVMAAFEQ
jgi:hypothetical protein